MSPAPARPFVGVVVRSILRLVGWLPLRMAHGLGALAGSLLAVLPRRERRVTDTNLALALPDLPPAEREALARASLAHLGRMTAELGALWTRSPERALRLVRSVTGEECIREARAAGRGVIVVGPHAGSWEMLLVFLGARHGITTLYRPPRVRELDAFMRAARERAGGRMLAASAGSLREMIGCLAAGATCGIACDQDPGEGAGVFVPFLGIQANTMTLPVRLASATGALLVIGIAERLPRGEGFALRFEPASEDAYSSDAEHAAAALNACLERAILRVPEQYLWSYKRFRIRPAGEPNPYNAARQPARERA